MAEFKPIESQEEFDTIVASRLERERNKVRGEYSDYEQIKQNAAQLQTDLDAEKQKSAGYEAQITDLNAKLARSETDSAKTRIAMEKGLPIEAVSRLAGTTEEEIRADADVLVGLFGRQQIQQPHMFNPEQPKDTATEAMRGFLASLENKA